MGRRAAEESFDILQEIVDQESKFIFLAGLGGGTSTGVTPVLLSLIHGTAASCVVTMPFAFEGTRRQEIAEAGLKELRQYTEDITVINQEKLKPLLPSSEFADIEQIFDLLNYAILWKTMSQII